MKDWQRRIRDIVSTPTAQTATGWHDKITEKFIFAGQSIICIVQDDGEQLDPALNRDGSQIKPDPRLANWEMMLRQEAKPNEGHNPDCYEIAPYMLNVVEQIGQILKHRFGPQLWSGHDQGDLKPVIYTYGTFAIVGAMKRGIKHERRTATELIG